MVRCVVIATLLAACGYGGELQDCAVSCAAGGTCPSGFSCAAGLCRAPGAAAACGASSGQDGAVTTDGAVTDGGALVADASIDAGPHDVTLTETTAGGVTESAFECTSVPFNDCSPDTVGSSSQGIAWYREFALSDFGLTSFQITNVHFGCSSADSSGATVTITVWSYDGALFGSMLDEDDLTKLDSVDATIGPSQVFPCSADVNVPISPAVTAGSAFVIEISATDTVTDGDGACSIAHSFSLGANSSGESQTKFKSYFDPWCQGTSGDAWTTNDALISVEGIAQ